MFQKAPLGSIYFGSISFFSVKKEHLKPHFWGKYIDFAINYSYICEQKEKYSKNALLK